MTLFDVKAERGCQVCPLADGCSDGKEPVVPRGSSAPELMVVGDCPTKHDWEEGEAFTGKAQSYMKAAFAKTGLAAETRYTFAVRCLPLNQKGKVREPKESESLACSTYLDFEIATRKPKVILAMGEWACWSLFRGEGGIGLLREGIYRVRDTDVQVIPTHGYQKIREDDEAAEREFLEDLELTKRVLGQAVPELPKVIVANDPKKAQFWLARVADQPETAVDVEGYVGGPLLCVGFSLGDEAVVVPVDHEESKCGTDPLVREAIRYALTHCRLIGQNFHGIDAVVLEKRFDVDLSEALEFDTMLGSYVDDERRGVHNLGAIAARWLRLGNYDWELEEYKIEHGLTEMDYAKIPLDLLAKYNGRDAAVTMRSYRKMRRQLSEKHQKLTRLLTAASLPYQEMPRIGIGYDVKYAESLSESYEERVEKLTNQIRLAAGDPGMNVNSTDQVGKLLFEKLKLQDKLDAWDETDLRTKTGKWTTRDEVLLALEKRTGHPVVVALRELRDIEKDKGTFVDGLLEIVDDDDRIRVPTFLHGSETGRSSMRLHNIKKTFVEENGRRVYPLLDQFVAKPGCVFVNADYSQIELRVLTEMSGDPEFEKVFAEDGDPHHDTASWLYDLRKGRKETEEQRTFAKNINFGIVYGLRRDNVYDYILSKDPDTKLTEYQVKAFYDKFVERHPVLMKWQENLIREVRGTGIVEGLFGRTRHIDLDAYNADNMIVNTPIQGSAHDLLVMAIVKMWRHPKRRFDIVMDRHDAVLAETPIKLLKQTTELMRACMLDPGISDWFDVKMRIPLKVEIKSGPRLGQLTK